MRQIIRYSTLLGIALIITGIHSAQAETPVPEMSWDKEQQFIASYKKFLRRKGMDYRPALVWLAAEGETEMVRLLLRHGEPVDEQERDGGNALSAAILNERSEIVRILIKARANVNTRYSHLMAGVTPIILAAQTGNRAILSMLIAAGADIHYTLADRYRSNALFVALNKGKIEAAETLIRAGARFEPDYGPDGRIPQTVIRNGCALKANYPRTFLELDCR